MRPEQDAYGELLHAIHSGEDPTAGEIIEREDGFIHHTGPATNYFKPYEDWSSQTQDAIKHAHGTSLDIGCGAGRHALYLQNEGFDVRGIDVSPKAVEVSADRGVQKTSVAGIEDVRSLPESSYDTILLLGNNIGLLGSRPVDTLNLLAEVTTDDAVLVGQSREATATTNPVHLQYHEYNRVRGRYPGCIRMRIRYKHFKTPYMDYIFLDEDELETIVAQTPWKLTHVYTDDSTPMYTAILEKK